ncbi:helix-turn-helix domain-containing protein [Rubricoccus marinus]|uniref:Helix-turn-helix domain-containing protein n=1 Tax=Rubricoccus marinus TaxID=716817 RepID=A0A259U1V6_9BACT|nr:helix-turn-helix domain-containing protein [Rubricoccus marinus]OZC04033.1 hypothetical protein BSZ36_14195 [Rubricoccus marinus]
MQFPDSIALIPASVAEIGAEIGKSTASDLLATLPEILRRSRLGEFMTDAEVTRETGLSKRQLRHLRSERRLPYVKQGQTIRYRTSEVFAFMDAGHVPARPPTP